MCPAACSVWTGASSPRSSFQVGLTKLHSAPQLDNFPLAGSLRSGGARGMSPDRLLNLISSVWRGHMSANSRQEEKLLRFNKLIFKKKRYQEHGIKNTVTSAKTQGCAVSSYTQTVCVSAVEEKGICPDWTSCCLLVHIQSKPVVFHWRGGSSAEGTHYTGWLHAPVALRPLSMREQRRLLFQQKLDSCCRSIDSELSRCRLQPLQ